MLLKPLQTDTGQESGFGFGHNTALVGWDLGAPWNAGSVHDGSKQKMGYRVYVRRPCIFHTRSKGQGPTGPFILAGELLVLKTMAELQ